MGQLEMPVDRVFITPNLLKLRYIDYDPNVFKRWQDDHKIIKLRNGLYLNRAFEIESRVDKFMVANRMYEPSYVSLYTALHYYSLIPEHVVEINSISTRKTKHFEFGINRLTYQKVKPELFFGYEEVPWRGGTYRIAYPEKAILDLAYLEPNFSDPDWLESMRFDYFGLREDIDWEQMYRLNYCFNSDTVSKRIGLLRDVYDVC